MKTPLMGAVFGVALSLLPVSGARGDCTAQVPVPPDCKVSANEADLAKTRLNQGIAQLRSAGQADRRQISEWRKADPKLDAALTKQGVLFRQQAKLDKRIGQLLKGEGSRETIAMLKEDRTKIEAALRSTRQEVRLLLQKPGLQKAISLFDTLIQADPKHALAHFYRGQAYLKMEEADRAFQDFETAVSLGVGLSKRLEIHVMRAMRYQKEGRIDAAIAEFDAAITLDPSADLYNRRGLAYLEKGDPARAIKDLDKAIGKYGKNTQARIARFNRQRAAEALKAAGKPVPAPPGSARKPNGAPEPVVRPVQEALTACTDDSARRLHHHDKKLAKAREACMEVIGSQEATDTDKFTAYMSRGKLYRDYDPSRALFSFNEASKLKPGSTEPIFLGARTLMQGERIEDLRPALARLDKVIELNPQYIESHFARAEALARLNRMKEATAAFEAAREIDPDLKKAHFARGGALFHLKRFKDAVTAFDAAIESDPKHKMAYLLRGYSYLNLSQFEKAIADFKKTVGPTKGTGPRVSLYLFDCGYQFRDCQKRGLGQAREVLFKRRTQAEKLQHRTLMERAETLLEKRQYEQALKAVEAAIAIKRFWTFAYVLRGEAYYGMGKYELALADFEKVLGVDKRVAAGRSGANQGRTARRSGANQARTARRRRLPPRTAARTRPSPAERRASEGRKKALCHLHKEKAQAGACDDSTESEKQANLAEPGKQKKTVVPRRDKKKPVGNFRTGCDSKDPKTAIPACSVKIRAGEKTAAIYHVRGRAYLNNGQPGRAIADFDRVFGLKPNSTIAFQTHFWRAQAYWGKKQLAQAMNDYDAVLQLRPKYAMGYYGRGRLHRELGRVEQAIKDLDEAIRLDPKHYGALLYRGYCYSEKGQYRRAIEDFDAVIEIRSKTGPAYNSRAVAYYRLGKYDLALKDLGTAIALNPKDAVARNNREQLLKALRANKKKKAGGPAE
jgi:tetratricopeptide (TPR) repeat protein